MKQYIRLFLFAMLGGLGAWSEDALANACQSNASASWNVASTWINCGGVVPGAADRLERRNGP